MPTALLVLAAICPARLPVEKVDGFGISFIWGVDRCSRLAFLNQEGQQVDSDFEFLCIGEDLVVAGWVLNGL